MFRSSKLSLKFSNSTKLENISRFVDEYSNVVQKFVNLIWNIESLPKLLSKEITSQVNTWLSARAIQCAGKQASGIVRGTKTKQTRRLYQIEKFKSEGKFRKAKKLQSIYDKSKISKPQINGLECELDSRFVKQNFDNNTSFDGWVTLTCLGDKLKIVIPVKKTKHFNKLNELGNRLEGIRLSKNKITFNFEISDPEQRTEGSVLGIDIGKKTAISCSNGFTSEKDVHGHTLDSIIDKLSNKKKGSKGFKKKQAHRTNYINWTINKLNLKNVKQVNIENIKNIRRNKRTSKKLTHWTYTEIFSKVRSTCEELGVPIHEMNPTYTSQRCSVCGWVRSCNRKGKRFKCVSCGFECDADLNASKNIAANLRPIGREERLKKNNIMGFYWMCCDSESQERIVPGNIKDTYIS